MEPRKPNAFSPIGGKVFFVVNIAMANGWFIMFKNLRKDLDFALKSDPAARNKFEIFLTYAGVRALRFYRFANFLQRHKPPQLANYSCQKF